MNGNRPVDPSREAGLPERLATCLQRPLPGAAAQSLYEPRASHGRHFGPPPRGARAAAVLILLYPIDSAWHLVLTLRPAYLTDHAGQISLPGGAVDPGESSERAALRELDEELGVAADSVEMLGELSSLYLFRSNFLITPWLGVSRSLPEWRPNPTEVAALVELPLAVLLDPSSTRVEIWRESGVLLEAPAIRWNDRVIWGATAMILSELAAIVRESNA